MRRATGRWRHCRADSKRTDGRQVVSIDVTHKGPFSITTQSNPLSRRRPQRQPQGEDDDDDDCGFLGGASGSGHPRRSGASGGICFARGPASFQNWLVVHDYRDEDDRDDPSSATTPAPRWGVDITDVVRRPIAQSNTERTRRWVESAAAAAVAAGQQEYLTLTYDATTPRDRSSSAVLTLLCPRCPRRRGSITGRDILLALPRIPSVAPRHSS